MLRRAHRAANFALGFAVHRMDPDAAVIHGAALLHDFAEMLLWCHAPALALRIARRAARRPDAALERGSAGGAECRAAGPAAIADARLAFAAAVDGITNDRHADHPSAKSVVLAIRLARHTAHGWENAALPDDVRDIGLLLNLSDAATQELLQQLDT